MEDIDEAANTKLSLGLSINGGYVPLKRKQIEENKPMLPEEELMSLRRIDEGNYQYPDHKSGCRKKLRLTKEQSAMLEDSFKLHSSLNPVQKQALAQQLNLNPRQVEVWFQNRRARSKLKQTEVDCEILKKCCENLRNENRRLKKELEELRLLKAREAASSSSPLFIQLSRMATSLASCSSCEKQLKKAINIEGKNNNINDAISEVVRNKSHILQSSGIEI